MTQKEQIAKYMDDFGSISTMDAFRDLGITRLSARIFDLRDDGLKIRGETITEKNRYGKPVHFVRYSLIRDGDDA